jgi:hypothetical protein
MGVNNVRHALELIPTRANYDFSSNSDSSNPDVLLCQKKRKKGGLSAKNQQILDFYGLIIHKDRGNAKICS